jgi:hypothetical protein
MYLIDFNGKKILCDCKFIVVVVIIINIDINKLKYFDHNFKYHVNR